MAKLPDVFISDSPPRQPNPFDEKRRKVREFAERVGLGDQMDDPNYWKAVALAVLERARKHRAAHDNLDWQAVARVVDLLSYEERGALMALMPEFGLDQPARRQLDDDTATST